jgi:hypothetical protein
VLWDTRVLEALQRAGAPSDLAGWLGTRADPSGAWEECDRGDWLIWLGALEGLPLVALVEAALDVAERAARELPKGRRSLLGALSVARALGSARACAEAASRCEAMAQARRPPYREAAPSRLRSAASSVAHAARAAEGLLVAEARLASERLRAGSELAAAVGVGDAVMAVQRAEPARWQPGADEASHEWVALTIDAAARAVVHAVRALARSPTDERDLERVEASLSEVVFARLDPLREALRKGADVRTLAPVVTGGRGDAADAARIELPKRASIALAAGVFWPFGSGHFYAHHGVTGGWLAAGVLGGIVLALSGRLWPAPLLVVGCDLAFCPGAVRRYNAGAVTGSAEQGLWGACMVVASYVVALLVST